MKSTIYLVLEQNDATMHFPNRSPKSKMVGFLGLTYSFICQGTSTRHQETAK